MGSAETRKGFTVVELIVAMTISTVTLLSGYELFRALKAVGDRQSADLAATAEIVRGLERIREDLLHAVPRANSQEPIFAGTSPRLEGDDPVEVLTFYALCPGRGDGYLRSLRQMYQVRYVLQRVEGALCLLRRAVPVVGAGWNLDSEGDTLILTGIDRFEVTFHSGEALESSFSSREQLPVGVEMTMIVYGQAWPLSVTLPCGVAAGGS